MHIPDGFLSMQTLTATWMFSAAGLGLSVRKTRSILKEKMVPLMGVMSAFIFAAQMVNFPIAAATSGHLLGAALAAVLLGPFAGGIVISVVLIVQCIVFQDGGITALGANIFNMSFVATIPSYYIYRFLRRLNDSKGGFMAAVAFASWLSVVLASTACAFELALSGTCPLEVVLPAMVGIHAIIGLAEAAITCIIVSFVVNVRSDLIYK